jgi:hypothetical protein
MADKKTPGTAGGFLFNARSRPAPSGKDGGVVSSTGTPSYRSAESTGILPD